MIKKNEFKYSNWLIIITLARDFRDNCIRLVCGLDSSTREIRPLSDAITEVLSWTVCIALAGFTITRPLLCAICDPTPAQPQKHRCQFLLITAGFYPCIY